MGSGTWSAKTYKQRVEVRQKTHGNDAFVYSREAIQTNKMKVHPSLDPYGLTTRESRDSAEHPESNSIIIALDETGSMTTVIRYIHQDLPQLFHLLLGKDYIPHPQIMFVGFGDAAFDQVPLQLGQFESDNRMDENLENIILEGNGGPYGMESYEMILYIAARHTEIDCYEKRGKKGYLFLIGDEKAYPGVKGAEVKKLLGYDPQVNIPLDQIVQEVREKYNVFMIIPTGAVGGGKQDVTDFWRKQLGPQSVIPLENPKDVSETIALTIGLSEGTIGMDDGIEHLRELGTSGNAINTISGALASVTEEVPESPGPPTKSSSPPSPPEEKSDPNKRTRRL